MSPYLAARRAYAVDVLFKTLVFSDDVRIRWLMALASFGWAGLLWLDPAILQRPFYAVMGSTMPVGCWASLYVLHAAGAVWRIFDREERVAWALLVNGLGVGVWVASIVCRWRAAETVFPPSLLLDIFATTFLLGSFVISGFGSRKSTTA